MGYFRQTHEPMKPIIFSFIWIQHNPNELITQSKPYRLGWVGQVFRVIDFFNTPISELKYLFPILKKKQIGLRINKEDRRRRGCIWLNNSERTWTDTFLFSWRSALLPTNAKMISGLPCFCSSCKCPIWIVKIVN